MSVRASQPDWNAALPLFVGAAAIVILLVVAGFWGARAHLAGAVVASGTVIVQTDRQVVQHPDGGVVGAILARNGDIVSAGDILVQLDATFLQSELTVINQQLLEIHARKARLSAESRGADMLVIDPNSQFVQLDQAWVQGQIDGQQQLFTARLQSLSLETGYLMRQSLQVERQIDGLDAQSGALTQQLDLIEQELVDQKTLQAKGLVPVARVLILQRDAARLSGEIGRLSAARAQAHEKISGLAIEVLKLSDLRREQAITRIRDLRYSEIELTQQRSRLHERLNRLIVRAPVSGTVHQTKITAVNSVVLAAEPMMYIVPDNRPLQVSARVKPLNINQIFLDQDASLRFAASGQAKAPDIIGRVRRVSPDTLHDDLTGAPYYEVIIDPLPETSGHISQQSFRAGMPVEVFIKTAERTPLQYLIQPLAGYFRRAFREE